MPIIEFFLFMILVISVILYSPFGKVLAESLFGKKSVEFDELNKKYEDLKLQISDQQEQINKLTQTLLFYDSKMAKLDQEELNKNEKIKQMNQSLNKNANNI